MGTFKLAVYGTLKKNHGAYHASAIIGEPKEVQLTGYDMYSLGGFPGVIPGDGTVQAEVHEYPDQLLPALDRYEGEGSLYKRKTIKVDGEEVFIYLFMNEDSLKQNAQVVDGIW